MPGYESAMTVSVCLSKRITENCLSSTECFRSQYLSCRMVLESRDKFQKAEKVSGP